MPAKKDLIGMTFGRLTVIDGPDSRLSGGIKRTFWLCRCECGAEVWVRGSRLTGGHTKSCGCWSRDYHREMMRDALKLAHSKGKEKYKRGGGFMSNIICECCGDEYAEYNMNGKFICDTCAYYFSLGAPVSGNDRFCLEKCFEAVGIVHIDDKEVYDKKSKA